MGLFDTLSKFKSGLAKTRDSIVSKVQQLAATKVTIDDELLNQLEDILIAGDVGVQTANVILSHLKRRVKEDKYESTSQLISLLKEEVETVLHVGDRKRIILKNSARIRKTVCGDGCWSKWSG